MEYETNEFLDGLAVYQAAAPPRIAEYGRVHTEFSSRATSDGLVCAFAGTVVHMQAAAAIAVQAKSANDRMQQESSPIARQVEDPSARSH